MLTELLISTIVVTGIYNKDRLNIIRKWKQICFSNSKFTNRLGKTLKLWSIKKFKEGDLLNIELPYGYTKENFNDDLNVFKEGLGYKTIKVKGKGNRLDLYCIKESILNDFKPLKLPPNKLLIANGITEPIVVDMNSFPHILLGGDTGAGKSRVLLSIISNLINSCENVDLHLLQLRKNDLGVFKNCKQVKTNSKTLPEIIDALKNIDKECWKREALIDNTKGYYNINDYNKANNNVLNYIYVVIEEFSFLNISKSDEKEDKKLKNQCLKLIKNIVNVGRSSGVFLITSLQKPTNSSIPSDIKSQLSTRVSLTIKDNATSIVVLGDGKASKLEQREILVKTLDYEQGYSYTINHDIVTKCIEKSFIKKQENENVKVLSNELEELLNALNR